MGIYDGDNYPGTVQENLILHRENLYALQQQINQQSSKTGTAGIDERVADLEAWEGDVDYYLAHVDVGALYPVFVVGTTKNLYLKFYYNGWSGWVNCGGQLSDQPHWAFYWGPTLDVFCRGTDNATYHLQLRTDPPATYSGGVWTPRIIVNWESLGGADLY